MHVILIMLGVAALLIVAMMADRFSHTDTELKAMEADQRKELSDQANASLFCGLVVMVGLTFLLNYLIELVR